MAIDRRRMTGGYMPLRQAIDQLFEGSFITPQVFGSQGGGFPAANLCTTDDDVILKMAIPGAKPSDINVSVTGDTVTVTGHVKNEWSNQSQSNDGQSGQSPATRQSGQTQASSQSQSSQQGQKSQQGKQSPQPYFEEIWEGSFQRTFTLPVQVDANKANATFENGILTLTLPKSEATKPRKIPVQQRHTIEGQSPSGQSAQAQSGSTQTEKVPIHSGSSS